MKPLPPALQRTVSQAASLARARAQGASVAPGLMVPTMPVNTYRPPPAPPAGRPEQQPIGGRGSEYEVVRVPIRLTQEMIRVPTGLGAGDMSDEIAVFSSQRPWTGCDVYVDTVDLGIAADFYWKVRVYAFLQGIRTEVDSAFLPLQIAPQQVWACAARALAERFDVTVQLVTLNAALFTAADVTVTVLCSDKATDTRARASEQALSIAGEQVFPFTTQMPYTHDQMRISGYALTSNAPAPVWLQFRNGQLTTDPIIHTVGVNQGGNVIVRESRALQSLLFPDGLVVSLSTDPETYAFPGGNLVYWSLFVK